MDQKPKITRRRNLEPGKARTCSQQVKVSAEDRERIAQLARREGLTPSSWCYRVIMAAVEAKRQELKKPEPDLRLVRVEDARDEESSELVRA